MDMNTTALSRPARAYVGAVTVLGFCAIAQSAYELYVTSIGWSWVVLAVMTLLTGSATVKLPSVPATISVSETFVFTSVLLFGPAAGTLTVALDALIISLWLVRRGHPLYRIVFNVCALPASLWLGAHLFYWSWGTRPLSFLHDPVDIKGLIGPLILFTISYFLLNSWLIAFAISLEKRLSPATIWKDNFAWLSLNYFGGASVAALLVTYTRHIDFTYIAFVLPLLAILYITFSVSMGRARDANKHLTELNTLYMSTIETLAMAIDAKDQITHGHIRRVQHYATQLAGALGVNDPAQIKAIEAASLLHDMGKLAVPEYILNKPGLLTPAEFDKMKLHASVGADILSAIEFPYPVVPIVRHHHENWNGTGYPDGLRGSDIPIGARILAVVDCFDALTSDRPYRPRLSDADALGIITQRRGAMYDPLIVDTFISVHNQLAPPNSDLISGKYPLAALSRQISLSDRSASGSRLDDINASTEEMLVLYDLAQHLTGPLDLVNAADIISRHLRRVIPASTFVFYLYDQVSDELDAVHATGDHAASLTGLRIPRGQRLTGWVAANKQTILNSDPVLDLGEAARTVTPRLRSCLSTPLMTDNDLVGVLTLYSVHADVFTEDHRRIIEVVARQISQTVRRAMDSDVGRRGTVSDKATELPTLHHFLPMVASQLSGDIGHSTLSLIVLRVDCGATSRRGRGPIDEVLTQIANAVREVIRGTDVLCKYGIDELIILLGQTDADAVARVANRVSGRLSESALNSRNPDGGQLTVSLGVASAPGDGASIESLVSAARARESSAPRQLPQRPSSVH
jgi:diguanylate cyclase (GGDEF)-like protein/putative nucleotidyltransferase with HDIG domain